MTSRAHRRYSPRRYSPARSRESTLAPRAPALAALDGGVIAAVLVLAAVGLVMIYSLTAPMASDRALPVHLTRHIAALAASALCLTLVLRAPLEWWRRFALPCWGASLVLLALTLAIGVEVNGARRWLSLGPARLQPAEFAKLATLLAACAVSSERRTRNAEWKTVAAAGVLCAAPIALLLAQPDFGSSAVIVAMVGVVLFVAGAPLRALAAPAGVALVGAAGFVALKPYAHSRWTGFLDPWAVASREGFQLVQSFVAFGRGGPFGVGLGDGRQKLFYLPEGHTDFILSGIAEELGLVGVSVVLGAFAAFCVAGTRIARRAEDPFAGLVAFAMTAFVGLPAAINAAVVMGLLPTTGFTLPFVSFGGNSLVACSMAVGILLRIGACEAAPHAPRWSGASRRGIARAGAST